jgi:hypothetical protein
VIKISVALEENTKLLQPAVVPDYNGFAVAAL